MLYKIKNHSTTIHQQEDRHTMFRKLTRRDSAFTLVEIMVIVALIGMLSAIAVPNFLRSRKRAQATQVLEDLRIVDYAIDQYAIECGKSTDFNPVFTDLQPYIKRDTRLYASGNADILGNSFGTFTVDTTPKVPPASFTALSDVAPSSFWSPYY